ncbi:MAG: zinc ABC transporter substrate-binding protein [Marinilabiliales bacterium]|nr:MAG: zinc ABC transporter substrate-binding protein [Marinilabiliales bacterium]
MIRIKILPLLLILLLAACGGGMQERDKPVITVSIVPQKYFVERIAGDRFDINILVPPGAEPETYEPTPRQMQEVANSLVYFRIGYIEFERTVLRNLGTAGNGPLVVNTAYGMDLIAADIVDHGDHVHLYGVDPHIWLTAPGVKIQAGNMLDALVEADPDNAPLYNENYNNFALELDRLHAELTGKLNGLSRRTFIVFHPALGYFARDYDLTQISIEEEGKNPTVANMRKVVDIARQEGISDVFIQMEFERENARAVARELGGDVIELKPLSANWSANMREMADKIYEVLKE